MPRRFQRRLYLAVAVGAFLLVLVSFTIRIFVWRAMIHSVDAAVEAAELQTAIDEAHSQLQDAESSQRGFLLTDHSVYKNRYDRSVQILRRRMESVRKKLTDHPEYGSWYTEWDGLVNDTVKEMDSTFAAAQNEGKLQALSIIRTGAGQDQMNEIRKLVGNSSEAWRQFLPSRTAERLAWTRTAERWTLVAGLSGVLAGVAALFLLRMVFRHARGEEEMAQRAEFAEQVGRQKNAFFANMSHEIRTPMNAVLGFAELLEIDARSDAHKRYCRAIRDAGNSLLQLISDILDLSRMDAGMMVIRPVPTDVRSAAEFVQTVLGQQAVTKGLELDVRVADDVPRALLLDGDRLRQVLVNLASNAVRFTEQGYVRVSIRAERDERARSHVRLAMTVEDSGIGIPEDKLEHIFLPFTQAGLRRDIEQSGTGLGLSIVRRITELMGGAVSVKSALGGGSLFEIVLPNVEISARIPDADLPETGPSDFNLLKPSTLLVVDDNPVNRELLASIFAATHHTLRFATNGKEALESILASRPDVVLMDLRMPVMTGLEALAEIRRREGLELLPVIAVTASSLPSEVGALKKQFSSHLRKPFTQSSLWRELALFLPQIAPAEDSAPNGGAAPPPGSDSPAVAWSTILTKLQRMESSAWKRLSRSPDIAAVREFADRLFLLAEAADCAPLRDYAEDLRDYAGRYASDDMERHLAAFPQLIEQIRDHTPAPHPDESIVRKPFV